MNFNTIAKKCPCPVILTRNCLNTTSYYYSKAVYANKRRIEINSMGNYAEDIVSLIHEKVHAEHETKKCKCMNLTNRTLAEYHAYKEGLQIALKSGKKAIIKKTILLIKSQAELNYPNEHTSAAKRVMKLKIWQKCLDYLAK